MVPRERRCPRLREPSRSIPDRQLSPRFHQNSVQLTTPTKHLVYSVVEAIESNNPQNGEKWNTSLSFSSRITRLQKSLRPFDKHGVFQYACWFQSPPVAGNHQLLRQPATGSTRCNGTLLACCSPVGKWACQRLNGKRSSRPQG